MFGDVLENLAPQDLRPFGRIDQLGADHPLVAGTPSNEEILNATRVFYQANQDTIDTTATNTGSVSTQDSSFVRSLNGYTDDFEKNSLPSGAVSQTSAGIFGSAGTGGLFEDTLDKIQAKDLFTTIALGVSAEVVFFIGGYGGLGCAWDIAKREGPRGYGFATGMLGLKIDASVNIQATIFNLLPSQLSTNIFGLSVSAGLGVHLSFAPFFTLVDSKLTILGYSVSAGVGLGGGAAVFGGHLWNFG